MLALPSLPQHNVHPPIAHCFEALQEFHTLMPTRFYHPAFTRGLFWIFLRVRFRFVFIMLLARARQRWYLVFTIVYSTFFQLGPPLLNPLLKCSQLCDLMLFALSWDSFHPPRHRSASWIRQSYAFLIVAPLLLHHHPSRSKSSPHHHHPWLLRLWPGATASDSGYVGSSQKTWLVLLGSLANCQTRFTITHLLPDQWRCKNCDISWCMDMTFWIFQAWLKRNINKVVVPLQLLIIFQRTPDLFLKPGIRKCLHTTWMRDQM